jgi:hypothetical protein
MFKKLALSTAFAATALTALPAAAEAQSRYGYSNGYGNRSYGQTYGYGQRYGYNQGYGYNQNYAGQRYSNQRYANSRYYHHYGTRCSGSTGTILGAIAGGLLGSSVAGRGDHTVGAILGGAAGALAGRAIDRGDCR